MFFNKNCRNIYLLPISVFIVLLVFMTGCRSGQQNSGESKGRIAISMPTKDSERWCNDGNNMKKYFQDAGYVVDIQYASNDIEAQISQIENMINADCDVLIIAPIDGMAFGTVLEFAKEKEIPVISYDRLIMNNDAVTYYATFDNYIVGKKQGEYIVESLKMDESDKIFHLEITTGDLGDNNAKIFYDGAMDVLQSFIDSGKIVVTSGQKEFTQTSTLNWETDKAQDRMDTIISSFYGNGIPIDACLCSNDTTALGVTNSLDANYTGKWPIITGQDADLVNVKNIISGKQSMTVFKDTRVLASKVVEMTSAIMNGKEAPVNNTSSYYNGVKVVPSYLCEPICVDKDNYYEVLVDSGYYSYEEVK